MKTESPAQGGNLDHEGHQLCLQSSSSSKSQLSREEQCLVGTAHAASHPNHETQSSWNCRLSVLIGTFKFM